MNERANGPMGQLAAHLDRGWDLVAKGDFAGAMLSAEKSLEMDEGSPEAHNLIGYIFHAEGRSEEAIVHYQTALELDESFVDAMLNAAEILVHPMRDLDGALTMVREALTWLEDAGVDERTDAMLLQADIHLMLGDRVSAKSVVRAIPDGPFENPRIALAVARARLDVGDIDGALPLIRTATEAERPSSDAFYYLGLALEVKKDRTGALIAFLQARELDGASEPPPWTIPLPQFEKRVQSALTKLPPKVSRLLEGALVVVTDLPGAEVVAEGVDPRMPALLDALSEPDKPARVGRVFIYKRNIERMAPGMFELDAEVARALIHEVEATFPGGVLRLPTKPDRAPEATEVEADPAGDA